MGQLVGVAGALARAWSLTHSTSHSWTEKFIPKQCYKLSAESEFQKADIFTKGLPIVDFERIRGVLMGW